MNETKEGLNKPEKKAELVEVKPLRDHVLKQNDYFYDLKKGKTVKVAKHFIPALKAEKVIK